MGRTLPSPVRYVGAAGGALTAVLLALSSDAAAEASRETPRPGLSYPTQIALAHAVPAAVMWSSAGLGEWTQEPAFIVPGSVGFIGGIAAAPVVHFAHGHVADGLFSVAGATSLGGLGFIWAGGTAEDACSESGVTGCKSTLYYALLGMTAGQALWSGIDVLLATDDDATRRPSRPVGLTLAPDVERTHSGAWTFGVVGWL